MRSNQILSPKYWVCHHVFTDDVMTKTMSKSKYDSMELFDKLRESGSPDFEDLHDEGEVDCILIEIKEVELKK